MLVVIFDVLFFSQLSKRFQAAAMRKKTSQLVVNKQIELLKSFHFNDEDHKRNSVIEAEMSDDLCLKIVAVPNCFCF